MYNSRRSVVLGGCRCTMRCRARVPFAVEINSGEKKRGKGIAGRSGPFTGNGDGPDARSDARSRMPTSLTYDNSNISG